MRNRVATIGRALDSIATQTHEDIDHVIVDGASTDGTLEEIHRRHPRHARISSEPDAGIYDALNKGIAQAEGEVVGVLHSDDTFASPDVLARIADAFADPAVDAVYGDLDYVGSDGQKIIRHWVSGAYREGCLRFGWMPPHPTLFLRRSVLERLGGYDTRYRISADYDAILRWFGREDLHTVYIPQVLVRMQTGGESNRSIGRILRKSREDLSALRSNRIGGLGTLICKNLRKLPQFFARS